VKSRSPTIWFGTEAAPYDHCLPLVSREEREAIDAFLHTLVPEPLNETVCQRILTKAGFAVATVAVGPPRSRLFRWEEIDLDADHGTRAAAHGWLCLGLFVCVMTCFLLGPMRSMTGGEPQRGSTVATGRCLW
jgi:hypothetical protein